MQTMGARTRAHASAGVFMDETSGGPTHCGGLCERLHVCVINVAAAAAIAADVASARNFLWPAKNFFVIKTGRAVCVIADKSEKKKWAFIFLLSPQTRQTTSSPFALIARVARARRATSDERALCASFRVGRVVVHRASGGGDGGGEAQLLAQNSRAFGDIGKIFADNSRARLVAETTGLSAQQLRIDELGDSAAFVVSIAPAAAVEQQLHAHARARIESNQSVRIVAVAPCASSLFTPPLLPSLSSPPPPPPPPLCARFLEFLRRRSRAARDGP